MCKEYKNPAYAHNLNALMYAVLLYSKITQWVAMPRITRAPILILKFTR